MTSGEYDADTDSKALACAIMPVTSCLDQECARKKAWT
jgi:hypothetical protein